MSKSPVRFLDAKVTRMPPPPCQDLSHISATHDDGRNRRGKIRPILGGIALKTPQGTGTIGLCYESKTKAKLLLSAAHLVKQMNDSLGQPDRSNKVGTVMSFAPKYESRVVDVFKGLVALDVKINDNSIFGNIFDYWIDEFRGWTDKGTKVYMEGAISTQTSGEVILPHATLTLDKVKKVGAIANYPSASGDSGAPIVGFNGEDAIFYGLHGGRANLNGKDVAWFVPFGAFADFL